MTKEELKEMIDSTINENGSRNITGKSLNLALNEIVDSMGSGSGGSGAATLYFAAGSETEEQKAANIAVREQCRIIAEAGGVLPPLVIDMSAVYASFGSAGIAASYVALGALYDTTGAMLGSPTLAVFIYEGSQTTIIVNEDGTMAAM